MTNEWGRRRICIPTTKLSQLVEACLQLLLLLPLEVVNHPLVPGHRVHPVDRPCTCQTRCEGRQCRCCHLQEEWGRWREWLIQEIEDSRLFPVSEIFKVAQSNQWKEISHVTVLRLVILASRCLCLCTKFADQDLDHSGENPQISSVRLWPWLDTLEFGIGVTSKTSKHYIGNRHCYSRIIVSFMYYQEWKSEDIIASNIIPN